MPTTSQELESLTPTEGTDASADYAKCVQLVKGLKGARMDAYIDLGRTHPIFDVLADARQIPDIFKRLMIGATKDRWDWSANTEGIRNGRAFAWHSARMLANMAIANCNRGKTDQALDELRIARQIVNQAEANPECPIVSAPLYAGYIDLLKSRPQDPIIAHFVSEETRQIKRPNVRFQIYWWVIEDVTDSRHPWVDDSAEKNWLKREWEEFRDRRQMRQAATYELHMWRDALPKLPADDTDWKGAAQSLIDTNKRSSPPGTERTGNVYNCAYVLDGFGYFEARHHVLGTAAKLLLIHQRTGAFPTALDPEDADSIDPFTDQPLIYRPAAKGFLLYSVGRNRIDDKGVESSVGASQDDASFEIVLPTTTRP